MHRFQAPLYTTLLLLFTSSLLWSTVTWSAETQAKRHLMAGVELFRWQEFGGDQRRLLSEQGARLALQIGWDDILPNRRFGQINIRTRLYWGNINYDGQTQSADPAKTGIFVASTSVYKGRDIELEGLYPLSNHNNTALLLSLGFDSWRRDIKNGIDAQGDSVGGGSENYAVIYSRLALQTLNQGIYGHSQTRAGIKLPLRVNEQVFGRTLRPGPAPSLFASYRLHLAGHHQTIIELYYDSLILDRSPNVFFYTDSNGNDIFFHQPQSRYDSFGIMIGMPF